MNEPYTYCGTELDFFERAANWNSYLRTRLHKYVAGQVLEVGAGKGTRTRFLFRPNLSRWICLEPDGELAARLTTTVQHMGAENQIEIIVGTIADIPPEQRLDAILYLDVLEHVEDDSAELMAAGSHLVPGGTLCVLAPAHQFLFSAFDAAIGHHRRYDKSRLRRIAPEGLVEEEMVYLDSVGLLLSLGNRLLLHRSVPTPRDIMIWDRFCIPLSRVIDRLLNYRVGKSLLAVWRKPELPL